MKYTAVILVFCILGLAFQPAFSSMHFRSCNATEKVKSCCASHNKEQNKQGTNDCCPNGGCNPFAACGCCFGFIPASQSVTLHALVMVKVMNPAIQRFIATDVVADNFHPPELV